MESYAAVNIDPWSLLLVYILVRRCNDRQKRGLIFHVDDRVIVVSGMVDMVFESHQPRYRISEEHSEGRYTITRGTISEESIVAWGR
jgi:hypothetical protein